VRQPSLAKTRLYLHLNLADLLPAPLCVGRAERLDPVTAQRNRTWLGDSRATIVPVLHLPPTVASEALGQEWAVDQHDPPEAMRETVILRDGHCVFPWCTVEARSCDLDHIEPYLSPDQVGPPGQTAASKLACLCRRHHNTKTSRRWRYQANPDGSYTWHSPHGLSYLVTPLGTTALPPA
jgi:hypothetical protein